MINAERFYPAFEQRMAQASRSIDIRVCIFDRDDVAVRIAHLLKQRSTNVGVRVMFDHTRSRTSSHAPPGTPMPTNFVPPKFISRYLKEDSQVKVRPFLNRFVTSDHRKVFIINGRYAYLGGMNLGREYRYEWHDMMAEIEGPVVASLQWEFHKNWTMPAPLATLPLRSVSCLQSVLRRR